MQSKKLTIDELGTFAAMKGFIYGPEPEIYGGVAGFYTYGPLGKLLKNNVENAIRKIFVKHDMWEVECPTVMPEIVWKASRHLDGFSDQFLVCPKCDCKLRVDHLFEEEFKGKKIPKDVVKFLKDSKFKCPSCKKDCDWILRDHDLMMKTTIGVDTVAYNRPETATTTYLPFNRYLKFFREKLPFGVFQIGKAYRNEFSPRQNVIRGREFTQAEGQLFILKEDKNKFPLFDKVRGNKLSLLAHGSKKLEKLSLLDAVKKKYLKNKAYAWTLHLAYELFIEIGIEKDNIRFRQHSPDELAFYADDAWDLEINLHSLGWIECAGIHDRVDDLEQHEKYSKKKLRVGGKLPHILEIAFGSDRPTFALIDQAYDDDKKRGNIVLHFDPKLAPIKVSIFPLVKKLEKEAWVVYDNLSKSFVCTYDKGGSIGRRYARVDEMGVPYAITYDFDSLKDKSVTLRDRDSTKQVRIEITELNDVLRRLIDGEVSFKEL